MRPVDSQGRLRGGSRTWVWRRNHREVSQRGWGALEVGSRGGLTCRALGGSEDRRRGGQVIKGLDIKQQDQVFAAVGGTPGEL